MKNRRFRILWILLLWFGGCVPLIPEEKREGWARDGDLDSRPIITYPEKPRGTGTPRPKGPLLLSPKVDTFKAFLRLPERDMDPALGALLFAAEDYPGLPVEPFLRHVDELAMIVREKAQGRTGVERVDAINQLLYFDMEFKYDPNDPQGVLPENLYLHKVLQRRKGYCVSLAVLYLALGKRLGLPLFGVRIPSHF
ncbi:MAG: transglutaminase family protein, partial [Planctomycetota bacterium]